MAERIQDAAQLARRFRGTPYETASLAYLRAQIEQAQHTTSGKKKSL
jgi:hypothetical protein